MTKKTALILMLGGAAVSLYDALGEGNPVYGPGKPLEALRWKIHTSSDGKNYYVSISDIAIVVGAWFYFKGKD